MAESPKPGMTIPQSEKTPLLACPVCGRTSEGGLSNQEEKCPYDDCGAAFTVIIKKKG